MILREVEKRTGILNRLAGCFRDYRNEERIEHTVGSLIRQRVYGIALGYEDLNDHDSLRHDVVMGLLSEKQQPSGTDRLREQDQGKPIAGKSTLNRLELTPEMPMRRAAIRKLWQTVEPSMKLNGHSVCGILSERTVRGRTRRGWHR